MEILLMHTAREVGHLNSKKRKKPKMYPRVRVRKQEQQEEEEEYELSPPKENGALLFLKIIESLALQEKENQSLSPPAASITRTTKPNVSGLATPPVSASKANDGIIGTRSKVNKSGRSSGLRKCNSEPKKPTQIQDIASQAKTERHMAIGNIRKGSKPLSSAACSFSNNKKRALSSRIGGSNPKNILEQQ
ncbi:conserved hypothetical protein [Ricinus communis]|uniref:Uncharacterized protein n=1 Tax=Ricinus communis TaxID=3988 RepID=B9SKM8_RICCO|nr:conserved hypothetical protein [Ricinus communis]